MIKAEIISSFPWPTGKVRSLCFIKELDSGISELVSFADLTLISSLSEAVGTATVLAMDDNCVLFFLLYRKFEQGNSRISPPEQERLNGKSHYVKKKTR